MNGSADSDPYEPVDLQREVEKRKTWFYECQLRHLNIDAFRDLHEAFHNARLALVSETNISDGQPSQRPQVSVALSSSTENE